jgi:O-antigen/teichoic acid export membrane protein
LLLRTTLIFAPALLLTRVSALLLLVIATRLISQTEYGLLTLVVTIGEMTDIAVSNWLRVGFLRLGGKNEVSRGSFMLAAKVVIGTMPLALLISAAAAAIVVPERWGAFALAVGAYLLVGMIGRFGLTVLQMQQRNVAYSMLEALRAALQFVLPVVTMVLFHGSSFLVVSLSSSLGALIAALAACAIAIRGIVAGPARFSYRELFAIGVPMIVLAVFGFGLNSAERILLKLDYDAAAVAVFAAAYALARQPIDLVANAVNTGGFPELVSRFDRGGGGRGGGAGGRGDGGELGDRPAGGGRPRWRRHLPRRQFARPPGGDAAACPQAARAARHGLEPFMFRLNQNMGSKPLFCRVSEPQNRCHFCRKRSGRHRYPVGA